MTLSLDNTSSSLPRFTKNYRELSREKRMRKDTVVLMRGFDSITSWLFQHTNSLDQGTREWGKPSTLTVVFGSTASAENVRDLREEKSAVNSVRNGEKSRAKRKLEDTICSSKEQLEGKDASLKKKKYPVEKNVKKVKNLAVSMVTKCASRAKELKSMKSVFPGWFVQEWFTLFEEKTRRLRDGFGEEIRPDEDDLVRLQLEALLAEKSRLATENANLKRENQRLQLLVEYHQVTSMVSLHPLSKQSNSSGRSSVHQ